MIVEMGVAWILVRNINPADTFRENSNQTRKEASEAYHETPRDSRGHTPAE
jgi:hypothetical protein